MAKIKVLIVEDHAVIREGLKILVQADPGIEVAGEAGDGHQAIRMADKVKPDVVLMDLALPRLNGLEATRKIVRKRPQSKVLVLSSFSDDDCVQKLMGAGASGYLTKHSASNDLLTAIRHVNAGKAYFSPVIARRMRNRATSALAEGRPVQARRDLTAREREVLRFIAEGCSNKEIGVLLRASVKTVEKHRQHLMQKLDVHDIAGLTRYALAQGLIGPVSNAGAAPAVDGLL